MRASNVMGRLGYAFCGSVVVVALIAVPGDTSASAPGARPPPIPKPGPLAEPRSTRQVGLPNEMTLAAIPPDNPQTTEKIALGQKLFFDGRLSADGTVACATCHDPQRAFTDGRPTSIGVQGHSGQRNSPTVLNALYNKTQFWDGRARTLEDQAAFPITNPVEMGQPDLEAAVASLAALPEYQQAFRAVFDRPPNAQDLVRALASYERALTSFDSPFDRFLAGDGNAIDESAKRGWVLFNGRARCNKCHALPDETPDLTNFKDDDFHNIGVLIVRHRVVPLAQQAEKQIDSGNAADVDRAAIGTEMSALGRFLVTKKESDIASFKTPGLRNVMITGPYFHDGSHETLWDVLDHYNKGASLRDPWLDQDIQPLGLQESELDDLVAFMASLTSDAYREQGAQELSRQRGLARTNRPHRNTLRAFGPKPATSQ
jgi:cytochrome c peroxidase